MAYSKSVRDQLKNITPRQIIQALNRDGWKEEVKKSGARGFSKQQNGRKYYLTIHYHPRKTYNAGFLSNFFEQQAGWTESDLRRLKLIR